MPSEWFKKCSMNSVVPACTLVNVKSVGMAANGFYDLARSQPFVCQGPIVSSIYLEVSSVNYHPILEVEVSSFFQMKGTLL